MTALLKPERNGTGAHPEPVLRPSYKNYNPAEAHPLCKSGRTLATDIRPFAPGAARAVDHQTAEVERFARMANEAREAAQAELQAVSARLQELARVVHERQPNQLRECERLSQDRATARHGFARAAAALGLVFDPDAVTEQAVLSALRPPDDTVRPVPVPVPGEPGEIRHRWETFTLEFGVIVGGVPLGLSVGTLTGLVTFRDLQDLTDGSAAMWTRLLLVWALGVGIHRVFLRTATEVGKVCATHKYQGYDPSLPEAVRYGQDVRAGVIKLVAFWILLACLEGAGLYLLSQELAFLNQTGAGEIPWVLFPVVGAVISGGIMAVGYWKAFTEGCRELARKWPWQPALPCAPDLSEREIALRQSLLAAAGELIGLNRQLARAEERLKEDAALLAEKPRISAQTLQRVAEAEAAEGREAKRLRELLEYVCKRMGRLGPNLDMDDVEVPAKIVVFPFQNLWLRLRGERRDRWPPT